MIKILNRLLALFILAFFSTLSASAAGVVNVTEIHDYPSTVDTRVPRSVPAGAANLLDWQQPTYDGVEYALESIAVEKIAPFYTVTFNANGGIPTPPAQIVEHGEKATRPTDPDRNGYTFDGWYPDADYSGSAWDFDHDTVAGDMTLYAKWTPQTYYVVVFVANGGTPVPPYQTLPSGQKVTKPADITRDGYVFGGWHMAWDFSGPAWDFDNDVLTENTILYARWLLPTRFQAEEMGALWMPIARESEPKPDTSPVSMHQAASSLNAATIWTIGHPEDGADFTFEEGNEYLITYHYKAIEPDIYTITEKYQNQRGDAISAATATHVASGAGYSKTAPAISGYTFTGAALDGVPQTGSTVVLDNVLNDYTIVFTYTSTAAEDSVNSQDSDYTTIGGQPIPSSQLPELDVIFDNEVPLVSAPQTGAYRSRIGLIGTVLLLFGLTAGWFARKKSE